MSTRQRETSVFQFVYTGPKIDYPPRRMVKLLLKRTPKNSMHSQTIVPHFQLYYTYNKEQHTQCTQKQAQGKFMYTIKKLTSKGVESKHVEWNYCAQQGKFI